MDEDQGGVLVHLDDDARVVVDWLPHTRLDRQRSGKPTPIARTPQQAPATGGSVGRTPPWAPSRPASATPPAAARTSASARSSVSPRPPPPTPDLWETPVHDRDKTPLPATDH
ncbi:hypothetical protein [Streptomyces sp. NPDC085540]|uniref:hypothetical protein n=1 Tax=Streptomyces sp. NPDC085540 TaxID=3365730 RepID=UPI0037D491C1